MRRREFIAGLGTAAAWPARAQTRTTPVIGFLSDASPEALANGLTAFRQGLGENGYIEGRNVSIEYRWAAGQVELLPQVELLQHLAADLVRRQVTVIVAGPSRPIVAAKAATSTIPIVFWTGVDPVRFGLVEALDRPGGNLTGFTLLVGELVAKELQLVREVAPTAHIMAALIDGNDPNGGNVTSDLLAAARILGVHLDVFYAGNDRELEEVFTKLSQSRPGGLVISANRFLLQRFNQLADFTVRHSIPAIGGLGFAKVGGLISLGATDNFWRVIGVYAGRILKGDKPADLPVQRATKFTLAINMNTAKALGVTFPTSILVGADEVIE
jgi:putative tryptophan/tyrosine transport system substrate-binding protein